MSDPASSQPPQNQLPHAPQQHPALLNVPLHALHCALGGKMVPFAGYEMPVQYGLGVMKEHLHTRSAAGLFDVSHMGQIILRPKSGKIEDAALALESLVPVDILSLPVGRQRYALFTNQQGGILDDLMVANFGTHLFLVVNASCKIADEEHLRAHLAASCTIEVLQDRALLALQGPQAEAVLARFCPTSAAMRFMDAGAHSIAGHACLVSRSGYTGEDGYEISVPAAAAAELAQLLLAQPEVQPIGLGARDSLRLEAGLCLYGHEIDTSTTPVEADLIWAIQKSRREGGARAGNFPGAGPILAQLRQGAARKRVGLRPEGRAPIRDGTLLYADEHAAESIGHVTSGGFGPSLNAPIAMAYVPTTLAAAGTRLFAELRGQRLPIVVHALPFITTTYKR